MKLIGIAFRSRTNGGTSPGLSRRTLWVLSRGTISLYPNGGAISMGSLRVGGRGRAEGNDNCGGESEANKARPRPRRFVAPPGMGYNPRPSWGGSSVGRASRSQCEGRGFDPLPLHQLPLGRQKPLLHQFVSDAADDALA